MSKYRFDQIAINSTEKKKPVEEDRFTYLGLEHLDSGSLKVTRYGSEVAPIGEKLIMRKGDVLFGKRRAYQKKVAIAPFDGIFSAHGMVLRPKEDVIDKDFFPLFISSDYFLDAAIKISVGSLSPTINWRDLKELEFELPDLDTQRRMAAVLWAMNETIDSYKELIAATDELVKSQFIEMFGLPFSEGWPVNGKFADFTLKMLKGPFGSDMKKTLFVEKGPDTYKVYVQVNAIQQDEMLGEYYISKEYYESKMHRFEVFPGEYLITCDGTLGKYIRLDDAMEPGVISPSMLSLKLDEERIVPRFFETYWSLFILDYLISKTRNTALVHLPSAKAIGDVDVVIPDMKDQIRFAEMAEQSDKSKLSEHLQILRLSRSIMYLYA